jgi:unsaturated chondroitin disaccharide hydrolase
VGQLWWLWQLTGDPAWRQAAEGYLQRLDPRKDADQVDFDLGFLFRYSFALGHELTGEPAYCDVALGAADRLLTLVHPVNSLIYHVS